MQVGAAAWLSEMSAETSFSRSVQSFKTHPGMFSGSTAGDTFFFIYASTQRHDNELNLES